MLVKVEMGAVTRMLERTNRFGMTICHDNRTIQDQSTRRLRLRIHDYRKRLDEIKRADPDSEVSRGEARLDP